MLGVLAFVVSVQFTTAAVLPGSDREAEIQLLERGIRKWCLHHECVNHCHSRNPPCMVASCGSSGAYTPRLANITSANRVWHESYFRIILVSNQSGLLESVFVSLV